MLKLPILKAISLGFQVIYNRVFIFIVDELMNKQVDKIFFENKQDDKVWDSFALITL